MAAAAPSPLASSVEKTNGAKLSRLLIDGGTTVLRNVFDSYHPPSNLAADLNANYPTLNNLFKKRVLHKPQWDLLFPPGGATPDSKTFDITLLFLLLTNTCGLSPPLPGWHKPPPSSDTSLEANLARVKLYRNELYGHVTSTGVQTAVFNVKWQEISAVLVALGLNPAEVARLKSAPCGGDYISAVIEWVKSDEEIKSQLREMRETQQEEHKTLQDTQKDVKEVLKTQQEARQTQHEARGAIQEVVKTLKQVKKTVENLKERSNEEKEDEILQNLTKIDIQKVIEYHAERYQEGTRVSFFERVEKWLDDRSSSNRVMVISGYAGMGKSVISAIVCKRMQEAGRLSGSHFCQHDKARYRNAKIMLQSLACQLSDSLPEYKNALVKTLSRNLGVELNNMKVKDIFEVLFEEPLRKLKDPGRNILMVIDGLDESEYQGRNELLDVIANHFTKLPCWIRFLVTTRPEINIADSLKSFKPLKLEPNDEENQMDLRLLFEKRLGDVIQQDHQEVIASKLVKKSEGFILYAFLLVNFIKENVSGLTLEQLDNTLPSGISSIYLTYFQRLETELCKELKIKEEQFLIFLSALTAAREPLPLDFVTKMMLSGTSSLSDRRKVKKGVACISALLPIRDECIHFFHKSVRDWLTDMSCYGQHDFTVDEKEGHRILSELCADELDDIKQKSVDGAQFSDTANYALKHGVKHMLHLKGDVKACEVVLKKYVVDIELVYAKLCVSSSTAFEDISWIQKQEISQVLSENIKDLLNTLTFLLRKYFNTISDLPHVLFQIVLNEGGSVLSPMASNLLQNKYPEVPYMESVHKQMQRGAVLARFQCSDSVVCFDVSPQLDYMVCECQNGTIQLWSLHTGKLVWARPVVVVKHFFLESAFRRSLSLDVSSCYRSVVFHPTEDIVLPGVLSHAYDFDGDLKPLFPESNCCFTVCSISGDKKSMLTNCLDDARCIVLWSLKNGAEITRTTRNDDVLSFGWSRDGRQLAVSHSTGSICLLDMTDGFRTLAETVMLKGCGTIRFSPDCRSLFCFSGLYSCTENFVRLNISRAEHSSYTLDKCSKSQPWECESRSESGFLLGDPLSSVGRAFVFVLNNETVLRSYPFRLNCAFVDMLNTNELRKTDRKATRTSIQEIVFSLNGETVYVVSDEAAPTVSAWDVLSGKLMGQVTASEDYLLAVKEGVLLTTTTPSTLELWNFQLSKCVRSWTNLNGIREMFPISEEQVACAAEWANEKKVIILDTTSGTVTRTVSVGGEKLVAYNRKCQLLTVNSSSVELSDGNTTLWKTNLCLPTRPGLFSLDERFVVICAEVYAGVHVYVLDAVSGKKLHILCKVSWFLDFKFVSDEECVISYQADFRRGYCLRLFNVKSGDLLSVIDLERRVKCLAACPHKRLFAIDKSDSKQGFELIRVQLPQDKDNRKSKT